MKGRGAKDMRYAVEHPKCFADVMLWVRLLLQGVAFIVVPGCLWLSGELSGLKGCWRCRSAC
jgi:hypothetical protein